MPLLDRNERLNSVGIKKLMDSISQDRCPFIVLKHGIARIGGEDIDKLLRKDLFKHPIRSALVLGADRSADVGEWTRDPDAAVFHPFLHPLGKAILLQSVSGGGEE